MSDFELYKGEERESNETLAFTGNPRFQEVNNLNVKATTGGVTRFVPKDMTREESLHESSLGLILPIASSPAVLIITGLIAWATPIPIFNLLPLLGLALIGMYWGITSVRAHMRDHF